MNFELATLSLGDAPAEKSDALLVLLGEGFKPGKDALSRLAGEAIKAQDWEPKGGKLLQAYRVAGIAAPRLLLLGVGDGSARQVRSAVAAAMSALKGTPVKRLSLCLAAPCDDAALRAALLAVAEGSYVYTATKSKPEGRKLQRVRLGVPDEAALSAAFERAVATVAGIECAKEWANRPANHATPTQLAAAAKALAKSPRLQCEVLGPKEVAQLGMGAFLAVARGAEEPLRFIVLRYNGAARASAPVVLVGKGITFDTGGISIKPAAEMDEMKFDMSGAASVLGVFRALADLQPALNVVGLIPACENMPDGRAVKPGDVVTSLSGQTIEILNTDAEGRLVLCDALSYAERFKPRAVVDIATLTGACVIALGGVRSGLFASDEALAQALAAAGDAAQDLCWRMPLDEDYAEGLKTSFADVANVAGRAAGAVTAAKFLQRFAGKFPWAHLDIAGTAWKSGAAKGATGRPVGLLLEYLLAQQESPAPAAKRRR
ncbi:leucyl aminopeptidase [Ramlibacter sp. 2FC]|uniref:leucyl aminopeptidase n=1 Tax=Ramlibacter sp. 2FC TaxID=2502188 RepID=UPI0010F54525|nr:leucyl aminopeptidase [Ramlibacter sp. 2FC]